MPNQGGNRDQHSKAGQQGGKTDDKRGQQKAEDRDTKQQGGGHRGGSGNFAEDRERASEAGRKGGKS